MASLPPDPQIRFESHNEVLQGHVVVRILQIALVVDEPVIARRITVNVAVGAGSKSG